MSVTVKAGITEETIRKLMESLSQEDLKSVPPEIIHRGVMEELSKKTTREISVEVSKPGGEAAFLKKLATEYAVFYVIKHRLATIVSGGVLATAAAPAVAAQFAEFTRVKPEDMELLNSLAGTNLPVPDVTDIPDGDGIISTILGWILS